MWRPPHIYSFDHRLTIEGDPTPSSPYGDYVLDTSFDAAGVLGEMCTEQIAGTEPVYEYYAAWPWFGT